MENILLPDYTKYNLVSNTTWQNNNSVNLATLPTSGVLSASWYVASGILNPDDNTLWKSNHDKTGFDANLTMGALNLDPSGVALRIRARGLSPGDVMYFGSPILRFDSIDVASGSSFQLSLSSSFQNFSTNLVVLSGNRPSYIDFIPGGQPRLVLPLMSGYEGGASISRISTMEVSINGSTGIFWDIFQEPEYPTGLPLYISGSAPTLSSSSGVPLYISGYGYSPDNSNIPLFVAGGYTLLSGVDLYIAGYGAANSGIPLYLSGQDAANSGIPLFIMGGVPLNSGLSLYMDSYGMANSGVPLFTHGYASQASGIDLYVGGHISSVSGVPLYVSGIGVSNASLNLFTQGLEPNYASGDIPLFMWATPVGVGGQSASVPLFIGDESFGSFLNLFVGGTEEMPTASLNLVLGSKLWSDNSIPLYLHNEYGAIASGLPLVLMRPSGDEGYIPTYGSLNLFVRAGEGELGDGAVPLIIFGPMAVMESLPIFIEGGASGVELNVPLFVSGYGTMNSFLRLRIGGF